MDKSPYKTASYKLPFFKNLVMLSILIGSGSLVFIVLYVDPQLFYIKNYGRFYWLQRYSGNNTIHKNKTIFYTDDDILKMDKIKGLKCPTYPLLASNKTHIWLQRDNLPYYKLSMYTKNISCCYKSFYRPKSVDDIESFQIDNRVKYNSCRNFSDIIQARDEFVRVVCHHKKKLVDTFFLFAREKKIAVKPKKEIPYNVLIMGIDSVSRLNLHRTMPKTVAFLKQMDVVELLRYNKVEENTFPNLMPLLLGRNITELQETCWPSNKLTLDNCPFLWEWFRQAGFATALGEDNAKIGTFNYNKKRGFAGSPTDYYLRPFIVEAENFARSKKRKQVLCMNEKFFFKVLLDYVEDLIAVSKRRLFGFFWEISMTHDHLIYPMVMDDDYTAIFKKMHDTGVLNESIIFLMSDHGMRFGKFRKTRQGSLEDRLPFVFALIPPTFRKRFTRAYHNLKRNVYRLTTPFDMHATLYDLVNLDVIENTKIIARTEELCHTQRSISLFLPIPENRTCKSAAIGAHWCVDHENVKVDTNSSEARAAIKYAVAHLNGLLKDYPQCAELTLEKIMAVSRLISENKDKNDESTELTVTFITNPGGGEFEATLGTQGGPDSSWLLLGSASRLNTYGNQSYCVPDDQLKLYCYCTFTLEALSEAITE